LNGEDFIFLSGKEVNHQVLDFRCQILDV